MKVNFFTIGCLVFLCFALTTIAHGQGITSGPHMTIHERTFDFKAVEEGAKVSHAFRVLNEGDKVLEITKVNPS
jgi:hypothetical protein